MCLPRPGGGTVRVDVVDIDIDVWVWSFLVLSAPVKVVDATIDDTCSCVLEVVVASAVLGAVLKIGVYPRTVSRHAWF